MRRVPSGRRVVGLVAVLAAASLVAACSSSDTTSSSSGPTTSASPASTASDAPTGGTADAADVSLPCAVATRAGVEELGDFAVGRQFRTYVDTTRGTDADDERNLAPTPDRTIAVSVLYPATGDATVPGEFVQDAPPAALADGGSFPLVVYSHGVWSNGTERNDTLARWASAGYVVIAPTYPLSSGPGAKITDLPNQPGDLVFVAQSFSTEVLDSSDTLNGLVDSECLALAGHSLGGATTLAATFDPCCGQLDVRAVVDIAGVLIPVTPGAELTRSDPVPTLIVHGDQDPLVPLAMGRRAFDELTGDRWFLTFIGGDHNSMFVPPESALFDSAVLAFLDAQLKADPADLDVLATTVAEQGDATLANSP